MLSTSSPSVPVPPSSTTNPSPEPPAALPRLDPAVREALRDRLRALGAAGRAFHPRIAAAFGSDRAGLRGEKRSVGAGARLTLLALALLRGRRYRAAEASTRSPVEAEALAAELRARLPAEAAAAWPRAAVAAWLEAP